MIFLLILIVIFFIYVIKKYNEIITLHNIAQRAWADVIAQERQKNKILINLEPILEQYRLHESSVLTSIADLRSSLKMLSSDAIDIDRLKDIQAKTRSLINNFHAVSENYPELKASKIYIGFMKEITEQQDNIGAAIRVFNAKVADFNIEIGKIWGAIVNGIFSRKQRLKIFSDREAEANFDYRPNF